MGDKNSKFRDSELRNSQIGGKITTKKSIVQMIWAKNANLSAYL